MPRASSKRFAASIRPRTPSCTRSEMSIEFGIDAAMRRASDSTKGNPATIRRFWLAAIGWARMKSPVIGPDAFASLQTIARYRNGDTNCRGCVPKHRNRLEFPSVNCYKVETYWRELFLNVQAAGQPGQAPVVRG